MHLWPPLLVPVAEERGLGGTESPGTPKFAPSTQPTWRCARSPPSRTGRAELSAACIAGTVASACTSAPAGRLESGRGSQVPRREGRGARAKRAPPAAPGYGEIPIPSRRNPGRSQPDAAGDAAFAYQLPEPRPVGSGRRIPPTPSLPRLPPPSWSVECARAEPAALMLPPLPNSPLESSPEQSWRLEAAPTELLPGAPGAPAPRAPRPRSGGSARRPAPARAGGKPPGAPPNTFRGQLAPPGSVPMQCVRSRLESWPYRLILIRD